VACLEAQTEQPVSKDIASRILCLPIYAALNAEDVIFIADQVKEGC
jgi:dTDP-4-amino-4,6-dideoxygalactose transaminase